MTYVSRTDSDELSVNRGVQILLADTNRRVTQPEKDQLRMLDMMEQMVALDKLRAQSFDVLSARTALHLDYIERLEKLVAQCCAKLNIPVPFPGQDDDFGLSPRPKKEQGES